MHAGLMCASCFKGKLQPAHPLASAKNFPFCGGMRARRRCNHLPAFFRGLFFKWQVYAASVCLWAGLYNGPIDFLCCFGGKGLLQGQKGLLA